MLSVKLVVAALALVPSALAAPAWAEIQRVWLTHRSRDPSKIVVNWTTSEPGESVVVFGRTKQYGQEARVPGARTLHHVEIPLAERDGVYHYSARTGGQASPDATFKAYPSDVLRVAVVADWQGKPDLSALRRDDPHLLLTAGDNIARLWKACGAGNRECVQPYEELIDAYPKLFRSTPLLPVLGNHDREIRPRGKKPPEKPAYDVEATAFRRFFELPGDEWKWRFDLPRFGLRLVALDLNHTSDFGTTWQTCHAFGENSEQFRWYREQMRDAPEFVVTLYNERNATVRGLAQGGWGELFRQGTACVTGFGYFAERAEADGAPYYNISLSGKGDKYPDPHSKFFASEDAYILMTLDRDKHTLVIEIKSLAGKVLDRREYAPRL